MLIGSVIAGSGCARKTPREESNAASRPVMIEDILPRGTDVCFPARRVAASPVAANEVANEADSAPATAPAIGSFAHWCQLCDAARQRAAEADRSDYQLLTPEHDLLSDLPPR